jgi:prepilin-type processing-associated H-X9-DG protein
MAVPASAGGSLEFIQNAYRISGEFYFAFRHFQVLSNDLVTPRILVCPVDTRSPAMNFTLLQNANLSYFVGANADFSAPNSILAGDRNVTNDYATTGSIAHLGDNNYLRWTIELHRFRGNLLFADGRVEEQNHSRLQFASSGSTATADLFLPSLMPPGYTAPDRPATATRIEQSPKNLTRSNAPLSGPTAMPDASGARRIAATKESQSHDSAKTSAEGLLGRKPEPILTNLQSGTEPPTPKQDETAVASPNSSFGEVMDGPSKSSSWLLLLLLLLLLVVAITFELRRRSLSRRRQATGRRP